MIGGTRSAPADNPFGAYRLLERRATLSIVACLVGLAGIAWVLTAKQAIEMGQMGALALVGTSLPITLSAPLFMAMWLTMMVAMMFPTVAPLVLAHRAITRQRAEGPVATAAFVVGYIVVWAVIGLIPLTLFLLFRGNARDVMGNGPITAATAVTFAAAGLYQFTPWKGTCLRACRNPLSFVMTHDFGRGARGAWLAGVSHGGYCLGCCWALMAVLVMVGLMNLAWMASLALVFLLEKHSSHGRLLSGIVGAALLVLGLAVVLDPAVLSAITGSPMAASTMAGR